MVEVTFICLLSVVDVVRLGDDTSANVDVPLKRLGASHFEFLRNKNVLNLLFEWLSRYLLR